MIVHLIGGSNAAARLEAAIALDAGLSGSVIALPDRLHHGPLDRSEGESFSQIRARYWRTIRASEEGELLPESQQEECLLQASNTLQKFPEAQIWFWMAPNAADVVAYYHSLRYLGKHAGRLYSIQTAGLPFLDENGKVFFPQSFEQVPPREFVKARRLARLLSPAEIALDAEAWPHIATPESFFRFLEGGKKIKPEEETYFDRDLLLALRKGPQKAARLVSQLVAKEGLATDEAALLYRIKKLSAAGAINLKGDVHKSAREWELSLPETAAVYTQNQTNG